MLLSGAPGGPGRNRANPGVHTGSVANLGVAFGEFGCRLGRAPAESRDA
jgi:hypothetical protein